MKVWKQMVSKTSLSVGFLFMSNAGVVIMLKLFSKKIAYPAYIRNIITKIWYRD